MEWAVRLRWRNVVVAPPSDTSRSRPQSRWHKAFRGPFLTKAASRALSSRAAASPRPRIGRTSPSTPGSPLPGPQLPSKRPARADLFTVPTVRHAFDLAARASLQCLLRDAKASADVNSVDKAGNTPLHIAAEADSYDIVRFLLDNGASVDAISNEVSPAPRRGASRRGHTAATVRTTVAGSA